MLCENLSCYDAWNVYANDFKDYWNLNLYRQKNYKRQFFINQFKKDYIMPLGLTK